MKVKKIQISAPVYATESQEKVERALKNIFPLVEVTLGDHTLGGTSEDLKVLDHFKHLLEMQRIRDTANTILKRSLSENELVFFLNKQAAFMGKVNFSAECPMDPITVSITGEDLTLLIDALSPRTSEQ